MDSTTRYTTLTVQVSDRIATITLNRPDRRNAFTRDMGTELSHAYRACDTDDNVRVLILTGHPPAFCAGADLSPGDTVFTTPAADFSAAGVNPPAWRLRKPVIAAVNGHAIGIGLTLALQCDLRIMAVDATYAIPQVRRGILPDAYSHWTLPRLIGISRAAQLLLTGTTFDGRQAADWGLSTQSVPADRVLDTAYELARDLAVHTAPLSVAAAKRLLWSTFEHDAAHIGSSETALHLHLMSQQDAKEGVRAYLTHRPPNWTGTLDHLPPHPRS
ncbi:enoyl-CoA hydratase/isomerase family protein [Nocardia sp. CDC160]|uniref:enoyl-CoA hydratase/isomerase family protein n=1 Tax=Nocardia sp. CDC160 TaxID=3112166 RepID=UPI002DB9F38E|nr:enoyl-CoA hydratase-related protein [Nocardia sp. CDC160]MEC3917128.1 enoyl-CoA hydratase-related protein [Nocardia sp. CDC160]